MIKANLSDLCSFVDEKINTSKTYDICVYILIVIVMISTQIKSLLIQYVLLSFVLLLFSVKTGILFASILFLVFHHKEIANSFKMKTGLLLIILIDLIFIILDFFIQSESYIISALLISVLNLCYIFFMLYIFKNKNEIDFQSENEVWKLNDYKGGINLSKINLNYRE